ncbi:SIS domain-containing protein [Microlunatus soli]|uniref:Fructoselysine-6-P-deglycase FrlB with duplicated sugar isomerase (SIS) domain n=1 Tax=Microlunatus soli TaxID=630515 RepID=A0A1H1RDG1_9ACTN|nr:SIS domain-containing protein [Microlunatus soli]SDS33797.1 Fructoselysine-6-P-deglycase FrlB with duplicated sugar isomerase (SIS) domain [Microlunatus soli]
MSTASDAGQHVTAEIASQPETWARGIELAGRVAGQLGKPGERIAFVGCGTSWFVSQVIASWRESAGLGESDAFTATEAPLERGYDRVVTITRSGTTTEIIELLNGLRGKTPTVSLTADLSTPVVDAADEIVDLSFADERSVVQTRFATTAMMLFRQAYGLVPDGIVEACSEATTAELPPAHAAAEQVSFLGAGWTIGIANEAALKFRETSSSWAEAYSAMEYRHGPISVAQPGRLTWMFGKAPQGLADQVAATGAEFVDHDLDGMVDLVLAQRVAVARALQLGGDPDTPRNLTRSVVLS